MTNGNASRIARLHTLSALAYVREINAETRALVAAGRLAAGILAEDADHWDGYGCTTGYDVALVLAQGEYSDIHKELYYHRPYFIPSTLEEVEAELSRMYEQARREAEDAREEAREMAREEAHAAEVQAATAPHEPWWDRAEAAGAVGW